MGDTENVDELFKLVNEMDKSTKGNGKFNIFANDDKLAEKIQGYNSITINSPLHDIQNNVYAKNIDKYPYSPAFRNYVQRIELEINKSKNDTLKYVNIGKIFKKFYCNTHDFRHRLQVHIINVHKVRIWNKKILMLKLKELLGLIIRNIGKCDDSFASRNLPKQPGTAVVNIGKEVGERVAEGVKDTTNTVATGLGKATTGLGKTVRQIFNNPSQNKDNQSPLLDAPNLEVSEEENIEKPITKTESKEISIINNVRSQTSLLLRMFEAKVVSDKEYQYVEKINPTHWVTNPAIMASLTAVISNAAFYSGVTDELTKAGVANSLIQSASPLLALVIATIGTAITKTDTYKELELNKRILLDFSKLKDKFIKKYGFEQRDCNNNDKKDARFKAVMTKIDEYLEECTKHYTDILDVCTDYANIYDIICNEPIDENKLNEELNEADSENKQTVSDKQMADIIKKIRGCNQPTFNQFKEKSDDELKEQFKNTSVGQYKIFMNKKCTDRLINTVNNMTGIKTGSKTRTKSKTTKSKTRSRSR